MKAWERTPELKRGAEGEKRALAIGKKKREPERRAVWGWQKDHCPQELFLSLLSSGSLGSFLAQIDSFIKSTPPKKNTFCRASYSQVWGTETQH